MGSFANAMFSALLGWVRSVSGWIWNAVVNAEDGGLIGWIGRNWLTLIVMLCLACLAVDLIVHTLRWRPYKVWASFFRRVLGKELQDTTSPRGKLLRQVLYADGTERTEEVDVPQEEWEAAELPPARMSSAEMPASYVKAFARPEKLKYQEELSKDQPVQGLEDYPQPEPEAEAPAQTTTPTGRLRKRMARLRAQQAAENEMELRYRPVPPAVDKSEAYREPFYPPQWKKPADTGASMEEDVNDDAY